MGCLFLYLQCTILSQEYEFSFSYIFYENHLIIAIQDCIWEENQIESFYLPLLNSEYSDV